MTRPAKRALLAEGLGTAALLAGVVGSGIMGQQLAAGNNALALLANAAATGGLLYVLITVLGPVSGAHFNPAVSVALCARGELPWRRLPSYAVVQILGAAIGVLLAHAMFDQALWQPGIRSRTGGAQWLSEGIATFGLVLTILMALRHRAAAIPALVAAYIFAAYWFTASTSFANPAVTIARGLTQSVAGIAPSDVLPFVLAQLGGSLAALPFAYWLLPPVPATPQQSAR